MRQLRRYLDGAEWHTVLLLQQIGVRDHELGTCAGETRHTTSIL